MKQLPGDIVIVEGNNELNVQMIPIVPVSHFVYSNLSCWEEAAGFKYLKFRCRITNTGTSRETHVITIYKYRSDLGEGTALPEPYDVTVTLDPGKSTEYAYPSTHVGAYRYTWCFFVLDDGGGKSATCCVYVGE